MHRDEKPPMDPYGRFLRLPEVEATVGLKKSKLYALMKEADDPFPSPIHVGTRALWVEADIIAWKAKRIEKARQNRSG